jgi:hypothetical protein
LGSLADIVLLKPCHQIINGILEIRAEPSHRVGKGLQSLGERRVHVATLDEGFFQQL